MSELWLNVLLYIDVAWTDIFNFSFLLLDGYDVVHGCHCGDGGVISAVGGDGEELG